MNWERCTGLLMRVLGTFFFWKAQGKILLKTFSDFFNLIILAVIEMGGEPLMEDEEVEVVIFHRFVAAGADLSRGPRDLPADVFLLGRGELEEGVEALKHPLFPVAVIFTIWRREGDRGLLLTGRLPADEVTHAVAAKEDGGKSHQNNEVVSEFGLHGTSM